VERHRCRSPPQSRQPTRRLRTPFADRLLTGRLVRLCPGEAPPRAHPPPTQQAAAPVAAALAPCCKGESAPRHTRGRDQAASRRSQAGRSLRWPSWNCRAVPRRPAPRCQGKRPCARALPRDQTPGGGPPRRRAVQVQAAPAPLWTTPHRHRQQLSLRRPS